MIDTDKISPQEMKKNPALILDVRTDMECAEKRLSCPHVHVPLDQLDVQKFIRDHGLSQDSRLYILCRSGQRAGRAAAQFKEAGMTNIYVIEGGITGCEACGEKLEGSLVNSHSQCRAHLAIPLERQVRIAAGTLVLVGALLGLYAHPAFTFISAFVGAGLIFAGVMDRCGIALLLTRMPWNKI